VAHCGFRTDPLLSPLPVRKPTGTEGWSDWLAERDDEKVLTTLRLCTRTGRPMGGKRFVSRLEALVGRRLAAKPVGRPKKAKGDPAI
jgi:hypothetical protein